jgi:uncharacterized protein (DUF2141 family)
MDLTVEAERMRVAKGAITARVFRSSLGSQAQFGAPKMLERFKDDQHEEAGSER